MKSLSTSDVVEKLAESSGTDISIRRLLRASMKEFGGPEGFARLLALEVEALPAGSPSRVRILTAIITAIGLHGTTDDEETEDIESMEAELRTIMANDGAEREHDDA